MRLFQKFIFGAFLSLSQRRLFIIIWPISDVRSREPMQANSYVQGLQKSLSYKLTYQKYQKMTSHCCS